MTPPCESRKATGGGVLSAVREEPGLAWGKKTWRPVGQAVGQWHDVKLILRLVLTNYKRCDISLATLSDNCPRFSKVF